MKESQSTARRRKAVADGGEGLSVMRRTHD